MGGEKRNLADGQGVARGEEVEEATDIFRSGLDVERSHAGCPLENI